jgi:hypothetical protein
MNREIRRATAKSDKRRDKELERRRGNIRHKRGQLSSSLNGNDNKSNDNKSNDPTDTSKKSSRLSKTRQRLTGFLALMTAVLIAMNGVFPPENSDELAYYLMTGLSYALLGYFANLWLRRNDNQHAWAKVILVGLGIAMASQFANILLTEGAANILLPYLSLPGLLLGIFISEQVYRAERR